MEFRNVPSSYRKNYLPSKKLLIVSGVIILGIGLYFAIPPAIEYYQTHRASFVVTGTPPTPLIANTASGSNLDRDTDKDGIPDWQETLFGLDPKKADTDGDGTPDTLPKSNGTSIGELVNVSNLNKLTLAVYGKFENTPTESIKPDQVAQATSDEVLAHAKDIEASFKQYKMIDLNLGESESSDIIDYGSSIDSLINSISDPILLVKNIQDKILNNKDASAEIAALNPIVTKLLAIPVPAKISDVHLSLVNAASFLIQTLQLPTGGDELDTLTKSLIAQKNVNLVQQSIADINTLTSVYSKQSN